MIASRFGRLARHEIKLFGEDRRGLALVEFAIALPVMLTLYLGGWQLSDALACKRKVTIATRAVADLTSQYSALPTSQIDSIIAASTQVMAPYSVSNAYVTVAEIYTNNSGATTIQWGRDSNGNDFTSGTTYSLPASMVTNNNYLIVAQVRYTYTPIVLYGMTGPVTLTEVIYMSPRVSSSVART